MDTEKNLTSLAEVTTSQEKGLYYKMVANEWMLITM